MNERQSQYVQNAQNGRINLSIWIPVAIGLITMVGVIYTAAQSWTKLDSTVSFLNAKIVGLEGLENKRDELIKRVENRFETNEQIINKQSNQIDQLSYQILNTQGELKKITEQVEGIKNVQGNQCAQVNDRLSAVLTAVVTNQSLMNQLIRNTGPTTGRGGQ